ncbi:MAG: oligosaccharide flippase family protein [Flavobacteriales bacterium]|nr:oligosaccharide flippase family protein [Flavobacteriales bacterium]
MQRKFITNLALLLFLNFLIKPFWIFGIDRTVQNTVSAEEYGTYFALFNFSMLFNILLDVGITNYNNKNIALHKQLLSKYFSGIVVFKFLLAVIYFLVTFVVGYMVGYDSSRFYMLLFLSINQFLISFIQYLRSNIAGLQLFTLDSMLSVLDKTLMIGFCVVLLWGNVFDVEFQLMHFVYAQTLAYSITLFIVFGIVLTKTRHFKFKLDKSFLFLILKQTYPYALLVLTMTFYYRLDAIMLDMMLEDGERQASIYAQAYRLMDASNQIGVLFAALLLPMFANMIKNNKKLDELVKLSFSLLFVPAIVLAVFSYTFSKEIMELLYDSNTTESANVLSVLMACFVAIASTYIFGTLLTANGSLKILNKLAIGGMLLNFILNLVLIPRFQAEGSAIASLITQFLIVVLQIIVAKKVFNFSINYKFIGAVTLYVLMIITLINGISMYISGFVIQFIVFISISIVLGITMRIINLKKMYQIVVDREL